jgi:3-hydroxyisobutyrate dehydrogenase-like beta-hydroxyacid dehydrogenase
MAANLSGAGFELVVRDLDAARQHAFMEEHGCAGAAGPGGFAEAGVVVTMLPEGGDVREALHWEQEAGGQPPPDPAER